MILLTQDPVPFYGIYGSTRIFTTFSDDLFFGKKRTDLVCNISTISATIRETWRGVDMAKLAEAEDLPNIDSGEVIIWQVGG